MGLDLGLDDQSHMSQLWQSDMLALRLLLSAAATDAVLAFESGSLM